MVVYESVNVTLDPALKERLLSGELLTWQCGGCGSQRLNFHPLLYHDMEQATLIHWISTPYAPTREALAARLAPESETAELKQLRSDYRFRVVREFDDLVEKIRIFDAGLDDRAIEWQKCFYAETAARRTANQPSEGGDAGVELVEPRFRHCVEVNGERRLEFSGPMLMRFPGLPGAPLSLVGPESLYLRAVQHLDEHLPWPEPVKGDFLLVDQEYVRRVWSGLPQIGRGDPGQNARPQGPINSQPPREPPPVRPWWKVW